ncbi:MAG TPA: hypothetical protein PKK26_04715 [Candidatus Wallbacteria bacterium]|nr:hypothetical protein [Candidatus Wallbacteria bacterium]
MIKRSILFLSVFILVVSLSFGVSFAQENTGEAQIIPGDGQQPENQPGDGRDQADGRKRFMKPDVHYIGYAVESETNFEMAHIFLFNDKQEKRGGSNTKKIDGTVELGKAMYLIVDAKTETELMKIDPRPGDDESRVPKISKIKSCEGNITKADKDNKDNKNAQIELGQIQGQDKKARETPKIIGSFKIKSAEKEIGRDKKVSVFLGTITIDGKKYTLYLDPKIMPPSPPPGFNGQRDGGRPNGSVEPPQPGDNN